MPTIEAPPTDAPTSDASAPDSPGAETADDRRAVSEAPSGDAAALQIALPKGRMQTAVFELLSDAGLPVELGARDYRPSFHLPDLSAKLLKPQNIIEMLHAGSRDVGFAGRDWVVELEFDSDLVEVLDTGLDLVRLVAAAPSAILQDGRLPADRPLVVASEYERVSRAWIDRQGLDATFVHSYGATEVFPPEDADLIVDNTATGATLRANGLEIVDVVMRSSTRLYASAAAWGDPTRRQRIEQLALLLRSVLEARRRVILELNVQPDRLADLIAILPAMRQPTVSRLYGEEGYAVKAAVLRQELAQLIPELKARGGSDLIVTEINQLVV